jgi:hypothetical protein
VTASKDEDPDTGLSEHDDAALERLYRRGAPRSPAALDKAVLAHAAEALVATRRRRQQRLRIWSLAASLTLVTGLVWQLQLRDVAIPTAPAPATVLPNTVPSTPPTSEESANRRFPPPPGQTAPAMRAQQRTADRMTSQPAPAREEAEPAPEVARTDLHDAEKKAAVSPADASEEEDRVPSPAAAGAIVKRDDLPLSAGLAAPKAMPEAEASAAYKPSVSSIAAPTPHQELQQLLHLIQTAPAGSSFIGAASREPLAPGAFANRMATASTADALLKEAANWQLKFADGKLVAADQWLRTEAGKTVR